MTVTNVAFLEGRFGIDEQDRETWTRPFVVTTNDVADTEKVVANSGEVPRKDSEYYGAICTRVDVRRDRECPTVFHGTAVYRKLSSAEWPTGEGGDLTVLRPEIWFDFAGREVPIVRDNDGKSVLNSCGRQYDPPATETEYDLVFHMQRYEAKYNPIWALKYANAINTDEIFGNVQKYQAKILPIIAKPVTVQGRRLWTVHYKIHMREKGWILSLLDQGYYVRKDAGEGRAYADEAFESHPDHDKRATDGAGVECEKPILLDGFGYPMRYIPHYEEWHTSPELPFAPLNLPNIQLDWNDP